MQKKYCLLILAFALILGTTAASLSPVEAQDTVRFYVYPTILPAKSSGSYVDFEVHIECPPEWDNAPEGIVGWGLSIRVDPRALEPVGAGKIGGMGGFLEDFLMRYGYDWDYTTSLFVGETDPVTGTMFDVTEYIFGYELLGLGAGGMGSVKLARFRFKSRSDTIASPIDLFGIQAPPIVEIMAMYTTPDGVDHYVDVLDDGHYIAQTPGTILFGSSAGFIPTDPIGSDWHEYYPVGCQWWTLESWDDNGDGVLSESDQVDMICLDTGFYAWYHVVWMNPEPNAGDGKTDLIVEFKEIVPEFPLGIGLIIALAPIIPLIYLWRRKGWKK